MIKTRFAPSPTGYLHVGGLRTALYAYLFARQNKGKFILRIEDTDQERFVEGAIENLISTLKWHDLNYDEGPFIQSQRTELYREQVQKLLDTGHAYRCFCTKERLEEMRAQKVASGQPTMYDRKCLDLPESEIAKNLAEGVSFVIRQKIPYELIKFKDLIRGNVQFHGKTIDDQVLMKSDNFPTYHLANVVDDHFMEITHVIRGEEWLPSTPKHIALYHAFGWTPPEFAHIPLLLNEDRTKLSKRQGDVAVEEYIKKGYLKEAIINFIVFLGWNPGAGETREIFTLKQLEEIFTLDNVHKAGAVFNLEKLDWFNWRWQKQKHNEKLQTIALEIDPSVEINEDKKGQLSFKFSDPTKEENFYLKRGKILQTICANHLDTKLAEETLLKALNTIEEKILREPKEVNEHLALFSHLPNYKKELLTHEKMGVDLNQALANLQTAKENLEKLTDWTLSAITAVLMATIEQLGVKNGQLLWPLRSALSGLEFSPGAFEIAWALGKEETLNRINHALQNEL